LRFWADVLKEIVLEFVVLPASYVKN
jgi:hypothetical protein